MDDKRLALHRLISSVGWHRRLLAGGLAAAAVALAIEAATPAGPQTVEVAVAAHDLDGGATLAADDLTTAPLPPDVLPSGLVDDDDAVGSVLAGPVRAGEPITDRRLLGPELLAGWGSGLVAAPVRVADAGAAAYLRPGDRIDLLATAVDGVGSATVVAAGVPVLALSADEDAALADGTLLMVAATSAQAAELAAAAVASRLSFTLGSG